MVYFVDRATHTPQQRAEVEIIDDRNQLSQILADLHRAGIPSIEVSAPDGSGRRVLRFSGAPGLVRLGTEIVRGSDVELRHAKVGAPMPPERSMPPERASGRLNLRLPRTLHAALAKEAEREGVSLNQFMVAALAGAVSWRAGGGD